MTKQAKLVASSITLVVIGLACVAELAIPSALSPAPPPRPAPKPSFAVGQKIGMLPNVFNTVTVENLEPMYEERHVTCEKPLEKKASRWRKGDKCLIGNENYGFELAVVGQTDDDHVLLRYLRLGHDHATEDAHITQRCPQGTLFQVSSSWAQDRMKQFAAYEATRAPILKALAKEAVTTPKPEPPKTAPPAPTFHKDQVIYLRGKFKETVTVQNPEGLKEERYLSEKAEKNRTFDFTLRFGEKCVVEEDGTWNSFLTVVGTDGDDVMLRWEHPSWLFTGRKNRACSEKVLFFQPTAWVRDRLATEDAWKAKRARALKVLGK